MTVVRTPALDLRFVRVIMLAIGASYEIASVMDPVLAFCPIDMPIVLLELIPAADLHIASVSETHVVDSQAVKCIRPVPVLPYIPFGDPEIVRDLD